MPKYTRKILGVTFIYDDKTNELVRCYKNGHTYQYATHQDSVVISGLHIRKHRLIMAMINNHDVRDNSWKLHYPEFAESRWADKIKTEELTIISNRKSAMGRHKPNRYYYPTSVNYSHYKGVSAVGKKYGARCVDADGKRHWLGLHDTPEDAAIAYDIFAYEQHGKYALLNFKY